MKNAKIVLFGWYNAGEELLKKNKKTTVIIMCYEDVIQQISSFHKIVKGQDLNSSMDEPTASKRQAILYKRYLLQNSNDSVPIRTQSRWKRLKLLEEQDGIHDQDQYSVNEEQSSENASSEKDAVGLCSAQHGSSFLFDDMHLDTSTYSKGSESRSSSLSDCDSPIEFTEVNKEIGVRDVDYLNIVNSVDCASVAGSSSDEESYIIGTDKNSDMDNSISDESEGEAEFLDSSNQKALTHLNKIPIQTLIKLLLLACTKLKHKITDLCSVDILTLLNLSCEDDIFPASRYLFKKVFFSSSPAQIHHICPGCDVYIGIIVEKEADDQVDQYHKCVLCSITFKTVDNIRNGNIFMYLPLSEQLTDFLENCEVQFCVPNNNSCVLSSIMDGTNYKKTMSCYPDHKLSLSFSCDGVPVFKSSQYSLWPVLCTINELPPQMQKENVIIASIWFGAKKPNIAQYLMPFVQDCKRLHDIGISYFSPINNKLTSCKVAVLVSVCDTVARPMLTNAVQFNGLYGCGLCLHPGQMVEKGRGYVRVYPNDDGNVFPLRNLTDTLNQMQEAEDCGTPVYGMKGLSLLLIIPNFDILEGMIPDYMHCVFLGVARQFMKLWLDSSNHVEDFYLGMQIKVIDERLLKIKPPQNIARTPRSVTDKKFWKAHEWYCWLFYYSIPVLKGILPDKFLFHWALLVEGVYFLVQESVKKSEVATASDRINKFIQMTPSLYGVQNVSYNVHLLSHLAKSVLNWGPLWAHSAFIYENYNAELLDSIRSSNGVALQICERFALKSSIPKIARICLPNMTNRQKEHFDHLWLKKKDRLTNCLQVGGATLMGTASTKSVGRDHYLVLKQIGVDIASSNTVVDYYKRVVVNSQMIHSQSYTKVTKRNSYTVLLDMAPPIMFSILTFLVHKSQCYAIGNQYTTSLQQCVRNITLHHILNLTEDANVTAIPISRIVRRIVYVSVQTDESSIFQFGILEPNTSELTN